MAIAPLVLYGRLVTFDPARPVIDDGALYIGADERIAAVQRRTEAPPSGFDAPALLETRGCVALPAAGEPKLRGADLRLTRSPTAPRTSTRSSAAPCTASYSIVCTTIAAEDRPRPSPLPAGDAGWPLVCPREGGD